jgi:hypothetical protein
MIRVALALLAFLFVSMIMLPVTCFVKLLLGTFRVLKALNSKLTAAGNELMKMAASVSDFCQI